MNILVSGDSWGCGVWKNKQNIHKGMSWYLENKYGHNVTNVSVAGVSNLYTYNTLKTLNLDKFDLILTFFTNPFRDIGDTRHINYFDAPDKTLDYTYYLELHERLAISHFTNLASLNKKIYLIGGHNKVNSKHIFSNNLINFIPSLREFFYPSFVEPEVIYSSYIFDKYLTKFNLEALDEFSISRNYMLSLPNEQTEYFFPNGYHLNQKGHLALADYIQDFISVI